MLRCAFQLLLSGGGHTTITIITLHSIKEGGTLWGPRFYSGFGRFQKFYMNIWGW